MSDACDEELKTAFALRDNPFNPVYEFDEDAVYANLVQRPLMVHKAPSLGKLYVEKAGAFEKHVANFSEWLRRRGYRDNPPRRGQDHHIALIAGDRGTGKTTLASNMIALARAIQPPGTSEWKVFDSLEGFEYDTAADFRERIASLEKEIEGQSGLKDYCCVLVDDVIEGSLNDVLRIYDRFKNKRVLFLFLTTSDLALIRGSTTNSSRPVFSYPMQALRPNEAVAFVERRIEAFRDPRLDALKDDLRLYPYDEANIRKAVERVETDTPTAAERADQDPITLRVFNQYLDQHLRDRLDDVLRIPQYRIDDQSKDELVKWRIDLRARGTLQ